MRNNGVLWFAALFVGLLCVLRSPEAVFASTTNAEFMDQEILMAAWETQEEPPIARELWGELGIADIERINIGSRKPAGNVRLGYFKLRLKENNVLEAMKTLSQLEGVVSVEPNYQYSTEDVKVPDEQGDPMMSQQWYLEALRAQESWETLAGLGLTPGEGTVIALLDTGVNTEHEDLRDSLWVNEAELYGIEGVDDDGNGWVDDVHGYNFVGGNGTITDVGGHGTKMAGVMSMTANNSVGGAGLAYGAKLMVVKVSARGSFDTETVIEGIAYAVQNGADVINMSFGGTGKSALLEAALQDAARNCILVAASGNNGCATVGNASIGNVKTEDFYPAGYDCVIGVMAEEQSGSLADYSNWDQNLQEGANYDLTAPGSVIFTTTYRGSYVSDSGTSPACALTSAAAAILCSVYRVQGELSAPVLQSLLVEALQGRLVHKSGDLTVEFPKLSLFDLMERAMEDDVIEDTVPPGGEDMTQGEYVLRESIPFRARAWDNRQVESVTLYYRSGSDGDFSQRRMELQEDGVYQADVEAYFGEAGEVEYFFDICDGMFHTHVGSPDDLRSIYVYRNYIYRLTYGVLEPQPYTGKPLEPDITIKDGDRILVRGRDYTISYENNVEPGVCYVHADAIGEYLGSAVLYFYIYRRDEQESASLENQQIQKDPEDAGYQTWLNEQGTKNQQIQKDPEDAGQMDSSGKKSGISRVRKITVKRNKCGRAVRISWKKAAGNVKGYIVYASRKKKAGYRKIACVKGRKLKMKKKWRKYRYIKVTAYGFFGDVRIEGKRSAAVRLSRRT